MLSGLEGGKKGELKGKYSSGRCYIYIRVSRIMQVTGDSLDHQEDVCREYAKNNGLTVEKVFADKGVSGRNDNRKEFGIMRENAQRGDTILAYSISRLSRTLPGFLDFISDCESREVIVKCLKEDIATDSPYSVFMTTLMASVAELEANMTRQRVSDLSLRKRQKGETYARRPYGYDAVCTEPGKPKKLLPNLEEQLNINTMFELKFSWTGKMRSNEQCSSKYNHVGDLPSFLDKSSELTSSVHKVGFGLLGRMLQNKGIVTRDGKQFSTSSLSNIIKREYDIRMKKYGNYILEKSILEEYVDRKMPLVVPYNLRHQFLRIGDNGPEYNGCYVDEDITYQEKSYVTMKKEHKEEAKKNKKEKEKESKENDITRLIISREEILQENVSKNIDITLCKIVKRQNKNYESSEKNIRNEIMNDENILRSMITTSFQSFVKNSVERKEEKEDAKQKEEQVKDTNCIDGKELKKLNLKYKIHVTKMASAVKNYDPDEDPIALEMQLKILENQG